MQKSYIQIHEKDNVAVALKPILKGEEVRVCGNVVFPFSDIPAGHKFAIKDIGKGEPVIKYGFPIGKAKDFLSAGTWVNEHNVQTNLSGIINYEYHPFFSDNPFSFENRTFKGYCRRNGEVGIRNEIWIVPTVGCVNGVAQRLATQMRHETQDDTIIAFPHNYGCSQLGEDHEHTRRILRDIVIHPNAGGVLVIGLGCENNQPDEFMDSLGEYDRDRIKLLVCQRVSDEMEEGMKLLRELYAQCREDKRKDIPLAELNVGLKCGGSDGFSGITGNPLLGKFSDYLVAQGGTVVLTEVPEMFGAETILMNRCKTRELFNQTVDMIDGFKSYFLSHNEPIGENPSPGNKAGGISTLEEKSLGCIQKGGTSPVTAVLKYGERLNTNGLNLLTAPGNDLVASTALAASGCQLVLFTTGRGTPFGTLVPTMKISTNTALYVQKPAWIDFDAGTLLEQPMKKVFESFLESVIHIANGGATCSEKNGFHDIAIFKNGITL